MYRPNRIASPAFLGALFLSTGALAADIQAGPDDYKPAVAALQPGDTLHLASGLYSDLLVINDLQGTESQPIVIEGPSSGEPAVFIADPGPCCNTVEIRNSSYVVLRNITVDGNGVDGAFGVSAKDGSSNRVHHITLEGCTFVGHDAGQQTVAISTKTPTWGWVIRGNKIVGAGTGMYLGNSNGNEPFVAGVIENNLIADTMGYNIQIKWQNPRPDVDGMPTGPSSTIVRHNVFLKNDRPSPSGDRPNLLLGGFPDTGAGADDLYEVYGNVFHGNTRESLVQASGRVSIHDNVFVDVAGTAITLQNHDLPLKLARVYNNTIFGAGKGIGVGSAASQGASVFGNLIFADTGISGSVDDERDNLVDTVANAAQYVKAPSVELGAMDFYPLDGKCEGSGIDMSKASDDLDHEVDFNGTSKGGYTFRGAYAGDGTNPGWAIDEAIKDTAGSVPVGGSGGEGGAAGSGGSSASGGSAGTGVGGASEGGAGEGGSPSSGGTSGDSGGTAGAVQTGAMDDEEADGCACRASRTVGNSSWVGWLAAGAVLALTRRRGVMRERGSPL
jgi:hypothetical protein